MKLIACVGAVAFLAASSGATPTPIQPLNGSFESGPVFDYDGFGFNGHANLPAPWTSPTPGDGNVSGDTWSHLGNPRGLTPTFAGVFDDTMTAYDGDRWAGAWDFEYISQPMSWGIVLVPGQEYSVSAAVHASFYGAGGSVEISFGTSVSDRSMVAGVLPGITTLADGWQVKTLTFTATPEMATATWFHFRPWTADGSNAYLAIDSIPAPGTLALLLTGSLAARRRRH